MMAAPKVMSDEELYQLTGDWGKAAALRDEQNNALNQYNWSQTDEPAKASTPSANSLLDELKALYGEKGATERREETTEQGTQYYDVPVMLADGWTAWENQPQFIGYEGQGMDATPIYSEIDPKNKLGGFAQTKGDTTYFYDTNGKLISTQKEDSFWNQFGPMIMAAGTMGGGGALLGNALFGLSGTAASAAGNALLGAVNASETDQNILKGALLGGAAGAGGAQLGDTGFTVGDAAKALKFAENPTLAGAANLASPYLPNVSVGDGAVSLNDALKGVGTAQALGSGDYNQIFKALTGMAKDSGNLKSSLAGFEANPEDFIEGYFQPGGEGYIAPSTDEMTVREEPESIDALLRALSPYAVDGGTSVFAQGEDIPELETVSNRPITSLDSIFGNTDILQSVPETDVPEMLITGDRPKTDVSEMLITGDRPQTDVPEMVITDERPDTYVPSIRTKDIVSDIKDDEEITIDKLFPDLNINDILQVVTPGGTTVTPGGIKTTTPVGTQTTQQSLANLGLGGIQQVASQDPYADIKLMEELFGPDIAYKLLSLGGNKGK